MENNNKDNNKINKYNKRGYKIIAGTLVVALAGAGIMWNKREVYAITVDDEVVAITKDKEAVKLAYTEVVDSIKQEVGVDIAVNEELGIKPVKAKGKDLVSNEELTKVISDNISYGVEAYQIVVNGKPQVVIENANDAEIILQDIANEYLPSEGELILEVADVNADNESNDTVNNDLEEEIDVKEIDEEVLEQSDVKQDAPNNLEVESVVKDDKDKSEVIEVEEALPQTEVATTIQVGEISVEATIESTEEENSQKIKRQMNELKFNEDVVVKSVYVPLEDIVTINDAKQALIDDEIISVDYTLESGDNIWDIAMVHGTTMERIMEINPHIQDETVMQIGDTIKVETPRPILSISTVEEAIFKEVIPGEVEYVEFSDMYNDETKVYQEGHDGVKELTVEVTKLNGEEVSRRTINEEVLKEAKIQVIAYGTQKRPVVVEPPVSTGNNSSGSSNSNSGSSNSGSGSSNSNSGSSSSNSGSSSSNSGSSSSNSGSSNSNSGSSSGNSGSSNSNSGSTSGNSNNNIGNSQFIHPLKGAGRVSSEYGPRWGTFHHGIDFAAPAGTPVYASAGGKVTYSGYNNGGYGYLVIIDHGNGYQTYYAHNSSLYVSVGANVAQGQHIAGVGTTGDSTGNHLHFEVRKNGTPINPRNVLK